jgi:hypothetical protein
VRGLCSRFRLCDAASRQGMTPALSDSRRALTTEIRWFVRWFNEPPPWSGEPATGRGDQGAEGGQMIPRPFVILKQTQHRAASQARGAPQPEPHRQAQPVDPHRQVRGGG